MSINKLVIDTLKPLGAPVAFQEYTGTETTYITFFEYNQRGDLFADNEEQTTIHSIQIDVFSKSNYETLVEQVKQNLKAQGFIRTSEMDLYESNLKLFRKTISFQAILPN